MRVSGGGVWFNWHVAEMACGGWVYLKFITWVRVCAFTER